jgi:competence ComEA-like helix-hairpin-helix protein
MWGREMRAGVAFVVAALLIGQGFREWKRSHERQFQEIVGELEARDAHARESAAPDPGGASDSARDPGIPVGGIDPNRASASELMRLPGIGPALAARIIADRLQRGAFASPEALLRVPGIGPKTLGRIRAFLSFPLRSEETH